MVRWAFVTSTSAVWMHIIDPILFRSYDGQTCLALEINRTMRSTIMSYFANLTPGIFWMIKKGMSLSIELVIVHGIIH